MLAAHAAGMGRLAAYRDRETAFPGIRDLDAEGREIRAQQETAGLVAGLTTLLADVRRNLARLAGGNPGNPLAAKITEF